MYYINLFIQQLLRHCIFAPINARIALLSSVGRTRIENCSYCEFTLHFIYMRNNSSNVLIY